MRTLWLEWLIAWRYTRAKNTNGFISLISAISVIGIALGAMTLITVLSVMNGFEQELRTRILGMASHATVNAFGGQVQDWHYVTQQAKRQPHVIGSAPYVEAQGLISTSLGSSGALIRGVKPELESKVSDITQNMKNGSLDTLTEGEFNAVLGKELALVLGVGVGDMITLLTPQSDISILGSSPRMKRFTVTGIFEIGMYEYDRTLMLLNLEDAQALYQMEGVTGVRLKLDDMFQAAEVAHTLAGQLEGDLYARDWTEQHSNFFVALQTQKLVMFIVLTLIIAVAAVNIISTMVMVVTDKQSEIAILRTIGATASNIQHVFLLQGVFIGIVGTLIGIIGGILLSENLEVLALFIEEVFGIQIMPADVYYISKVPSDLQYSDVAKVAGISFLLCVLATWFPARRAAKTNPAEALRYE
jgi:lipoprotein-releasing system permease protein